MRISASFPGRLHLLSLPAVLMLLLSATGASAAEGNGLTVTFYNNLDLTGASTTVTKPSIDMRTFGESPAAGIDPLSWSDVWVGEIAIPATDTYTFDVLSCDGVLLLIDGQPVVENWTQHGDTLNTGSVALTAGRHRIQVNHFKTWGGAALIASWSSSTMPTQVIPPSAFYPTVPAGLVGTGTGLHATYYADASFQTAAADAVVPTIAAQWGTAGPSSLVPPNLFSVAWRGWIEAQYTGVHTFYAAADDCFALSIDGQDILGSLSYKLIGEATGSRFLEAGKRYELVARHRQIGGEAFAYLSWSNPLAARQIIPTSQLYPAHPARTLAVTVVSPAESYVSPAWFEVVAATRANRIAGSTPSHPRDAHHQDGRRWYLGDASAPTAGILLQPGETMVTVTSSSGAAQQTHLSSIAWLAYDFGNPPYDFGDVCTVRQGDTLLTTLGGDGGYQITVVALEDDSQSPRQIAGAAAELVRVPFPSAGLYLLTANRDGRDHGSLRVQVVACDLRAPLACQVGFLRSKALVLAGPAQPTGIWCGSSDPLNLEVSDATATGLARTLHLRAQSLTPAQAQVRISGADGPLLAGVRVDPFTIRLSAETSIDVIETMPDGSLLTQATLTMSPLIPNLLVRLDIATAGAQFADGTLSLATNTSDFVPDGAGNGVLTYQIIRGPGVNSHLCHITSIYQGSDLVGRH